MKSPLGAAVYVSYAWGDKNSAEAVELLKDKFAETYVTFKPDKYTLEAGDSFGAFIEEIGRANCIIILYSEAYFKSFYCMLELARIIEHSKQLSEADNLEQHLTSRIIGIQVSDLNASCIDKEDIQQALGKVEVSQEFVRIEEDDHSTVPETARIRVTNIPYKSEEDQALIIENFDLFSEVFGKKLNHISIDEACFTDVIQKSRSSFIRQLKGNRLFHEASSGICKETALALEAVLHNHLSEGETINLNANEQKVACLLTLPSENLLEVLYEAQNSNEEKSQLLKSRLSELLLRLLPLFCQHEYAQKIQQSLTNRSTGNHSAIKTRYALPVSVENMMAAIDQREVGYITVPISDISDDKNLQVDNKYCLYLSPEGGDDIRKTYLKDTQEDLINSTGLSSMEFLNLDAKQHDRRMTDTRNRLLDKFTKNPESHRSQNKSAKNAAIHKALSKKKLGQKNENPHRYFIIPNDDLEAGFWDDYAREVHQISSKLVVIRLDSSTENYENTEQEEAFFEHIPQLLN